MYKTKVCFIRFAQFFLTMSIVGFWLWYHKFNLYPNTPNWAIVASVAFNTIIIYLTLIMMISILNSTVF